MFLLILHDGVKQGDSIIKTCYLVEDYIGNEMQSDCRPNRSRRQKSSCKKIGKRSRGKAHFKRGITI